MESQNLGWAIDALLVWHDLMSTGSLLPCLHCICGLGRRHLGLMKKLSEDTSCKNSILTCHLGTCTIFHKHAGIVASLQRDTIAPPVSLLGEAGKRYSQRDVSVVGSLQWMMIDLTQLVPLKLPRFSKSNSCLADYFLLLVIEMSTLRFWAETEAQALPLVNLTRVREVQLDQTCANPLVIICLSVALAQRSAGR
ncbi:hypothetical protein VFPPC_00860 [Pochonia chlamydosporia 170]|uniref:Uncharacterized protein n=1 Tax=Pochonia chlamydosporia 170 TaxID=1380566 RepID=A0A179G5F5_METCM|nr:hypothetical protein VFPPC_00860 [Pochonia chlamydosporia 170]OAQ73052.1 hypothetical protein VFPPC_00860 [Pochonia chlamydosporia 170]